MTFKLTQGRWQCTTCVFCHFRDITITTCYPRRRQTRGYGCHRRLSVYLFFPHDISITDAVRITKLDTEMFLDESIYFEVKRSRSQVTKQCRLRSSLSCECWLLLVGWGLTALSNRFRSYSA